MAILRGSIAALLFSISAAFWCSLLLIGSLLRPALPTAIERRYNDRLHRLVDAWIATNTLIIRLLGVIRIDCKGAETLRRDRSYMVISNHQTWADIIVLQCALRTRVPVLKFFMKRELIWVPFIGLSCWVLDFPLLRRYRAEVLAAHPELRNHDRDTTRQACIKFQQRPTAILNFLEGTRFTPGKHESQASPYRHLLKPKSGGFGQVVTAMPGKLDALVDVTLVYESEPPTFWQFLCGRCAAVRMVVATQPIPAEIANGDYDRDEAYRQRTRDWLDARWASKDQLIAELNGR